jgi:hypothetical protein
LAVQVLSRSEPVSDLATRHGVSRKFVYQHYGAAIGALQHWQQSSVPEAAQRVSEYRALSADLEREILRDICADPSNDEA